MDAGNDPIYRRGATPVTRTALSTRIKTFSYAAKKGGVMLQIGMVSEMSPSQSRTVEARRGIGFGDKIAELVPGNTEPIELSCTRFCLYLANIMQVFGYNYGVDGVVRTLAHHRWPFDVRHEMVIPTFIGSGQSGTSSPTNANDSTKAIVTFYEGCWMSAYGATYSVDDTTISETCTIVATDVFRPDSKYDESIDSGNSDSSNNGPWSTILSSKDAADQALGNASITI